MPAESGRKGNMVVLEAKKYRSCQRPTDAQLGELTNRYFNILTKVKAGDFPVQILIDTLQHVGDGHVILPDLFSGRKIIGPPIIAETGPTDRVILKIYFWLRVARNIGDAERYIKMIQDGPCPSSRPGLREEITFGRPRNTEACEAWSLIIKGTENSCTDVTANEVQAYISQNDLAFSPKQLISVLAYDYASNNNVLPYPFSKDTWILCKGTSGIVWAQMRYYDGIVTVYIKTDDPTFHEGDRLILKRDAV